MPATSQTRTLAAAVALIFLVAVGTATYRVQPGDTLSEIASEHGVSTAELAAINDLTDPDRIFVGQELTIPTDVPAAEATIHVVRSGESLAVIAARYNTTVAALAAANGITNPNVIYSGTRLRLRGDGEVFLPASSGAARHTVAPGETLGGIASRYGTTTSALATENGIANPDVIRIGSTLVVPGAWVCPVPSATFFNDYGFPRSSDRFHDGTDLFAPKGTPVLAPVSGVVEHVIGSIGGRQFVLHGDDGHTYLGSHMDAFAADGRVSAGSQIGTVGDSGNAAGARPHLHFEIHPNDGGPTNPYPALAAACG